MDTVTPPDQTSADAERARVQEALRHVESAVRLRQAQLATRAEERESVRALLVDLKEAELLHEAVATSPRRFLGPALVWLRRAIHHLFVKWQLRPVIQQQNRFNQLAARLLEEGLEAQEQLAAEVALLRSRLAAAERAPESEEPRR